MKHLRQYIRQILLTEAAMSPPDLEAEDAVVVIDARDHGFYRVYYGQEKNPAKRGQSSHPNAGGILGRFFKVDLGFHSIVF